MSDVLADVTDKKTSVSKVISKRRLDDAQIQKVVLKSSSGNLYDRPDVTEKSGMLFSTKPFHVMTKVKPLPRDPEVVFYSAFGPNGSEYRHVIRLIHNNTQATESVLKYDLEFTQRGPCPPTAKVRPSGSADWLDTEFRNVKRSHDERKWERIRGGAVAWSNKESLKLTKKTTQIDAVVRTIHQSLADTLGQKDSLTAVLEDLARQRNSPVAKEEIDKVIRGWNEQKLIAQHMKNRAAEAAESWKNLEECSLDLSIFSVIKDITIPADDLIYTMRIPVIVFSNETYSNRLDWKQLAEPSGTAAASLEDRGVKGGPQAPLK